MEFNAAQMREDALVKKGRYPFRVIRGTEKRSSTGNDMMKLQLIIFYNQREIKFFDNLMLMPSMFWKFEHFCKATGLAHKLEEGRLMAQDCDYKEGYLDIDHRVNKETGEVEAYVKDYVKPEELAQDTSFPNDDIPNFA